ncbi:unnamed protein product [Musa acuminata subsp. burmannicoides]
MGGYMEALIDSGLKVKIAFNLFLSKMRPIFCGNFEYDARQSELERLFGRYWKVDRVDMKSEPMFPLAIGTSTLFTASGPYVPVIPLKQFLWCGNILEHLVSSWLMDLHLFTWMMNKMQGMQSRPLTGLSLADTGNGFTLNGRRYTTQLVTQQELVVVGRSGSSRRSLANMTHTKTLFVRRYFVFNYFEAQEDATKALEATNMRYVSLPVGCSGSRVCPLPAFDIIFLIKKRTKSDVKCVIIDRVDSVGSFCSDSSPQLDKVLQGDGITLETSSPWRQQHLANQIVDGTVGRGVISWSDLCCTKPPPKWRHTGGLHGFTVHVMAPII